MERVIDTSNMTEEEITASIDAGDIVRREGFDGEGNEITQYELTDLGQARVMNNMLLHVMREVISAYHSGRSYRRVIDYVKTVYGQLTKPPETELQQLTSVGIANEEVEPVASLGGK